MTIIRFPNTSEKRAFYKEETVCNQVYYYIYTHILKAYRYFNFSLCGKVTEQPRQRGKGQNTKDTVCHVKGNQIRRALTDCLAPWRISKYKKT